MSVIYGYFFVFFAIKHKFKLIATVDILLLSAKINVSG